MTETIRSLNKAISFEWMFEYIVRSFVHEYRSFGSQPVIHSAIESAIPRISHYSLGRCHWTFPSTRDVRNYELPQYLLPDKRKYIDW